MYHERAEEIAKSDERYTFVASPQHKRMYEAIERGKNVRIIGTPRGPKFWPQTQKDPD